MELAAVFAKQQFFAGTLFAIPSNGNSSFDEFSRKEVNLNEEENNFGLGISFGTQRTRSGRVFYPQELLQRGQMASLEMA